MINALIITHGIKLGISRRSLDVGILLSIHIRRQKCDCGARRTLDGGREEGAEKSQGREAPETFRVNEISLGENFTAGRRSRRKTARS